MGSNKVVPITAAVERSRIDRACTAAMHRERHEDPKPDIGTAATTVGPQAPSAVRAPSSGHDIDWAEFLGRIDERGRTVLARLDALCSQRFNRDGKHGGVAEDARCFLIAELTRDNFRRCASFAGRSSPETYLVQVAKNLLEDYARSRWGRCRPPAVIARLGRLHILANRMLCCERREPRECVEVLCTMGVERSVAADAVRVCHRVAGSCSCAQRRDEVAQARDWHEAHGGLGTDIADEVDGSVRGEQLEVAQALLHTTDLAAIRRLAGVDIPGDLLFALREVYGEGRPLTEVAKDLDLNYHALYRRLNSCLGQLRDALSQDDDL